MEDSNDKFKGTVQYWLEVHRIGSLLFQNVKNGDNALKSLTTSIIETPLLSDIECLSGEDYTGNVVSPFASWLLEGFLKASTNHSLPHLKTFYTVSQSKLLISSFERDLFAFEKLVESYIKLLEKLIHVKAFPVEFTFILENDFLLLDYHKTLPATKFKVSNIAEQIDLASIVIEVIFLM